MGYLGSLPPASWAISKAVSSLPSLVIRENPSRGGFALEKERLDVPTSSQNRLLSERAAYLRASVRRYLDGEIKYNVHLAAILGRKGIQRFGGEGYR